MSTLTLGTAIAANGQGSAIAISEDQQGDKVAVFAWGTFGTGTLKLQVSNDGGTTWFDVPTASFTAAGMVVVEIFGTHVRYDLAGATGPSLNMNLRGAKSGLTVVSS